MSITNFAITYTFFDIGGGDAIWIRFLGTDNNWHNVLIDGGYGYAYKMAFRPLIHHILTTKETIDLWVISHIDRDHIGAVLGFVQDKKIKDKSIAVKKFWFNHSGRTKIVPNGKLSVNDGIDFREYLTENGLLSEAAITTNSKETDLFGFKITVVSPTPEKHAIGDLYWQTKESKIGKIGRDAADADHGATIEELTISKFICDTDPVNGSSIALLLDYQSIKVLLLADSHPTTVIEKLNSLGFSNENPLPLSLMQLAHHGSKANTSPELLAMIDASDFVVTGNGIHNRHPDKESLVRLLTRKQKQPLRIYFPSSTPALANLFSVDQQPFERYNFTCIFHADEHGVMFKFLPIKE